MGPLLHTPRLLPSFDLLPFMLLVIVLCWVSQYQTEACSQVRLSYPHSTTWLCGILLVIHIITHATFHCNDTT